MSVWLREEEGCPSIFSGNNYIITLLQEGAQNIAVRQANKQNVIELNFEGGAFIC